MKRARADSRSAATRRNSTTTRPSASTPRRHTAGTHARSSKTSRQSGQARSSTSFVLAFLLPHRPSPAREADQDLLRPLATGDKRTADLLGRSDGRVARAPRQTSRRRPRPEPAPASAFVFHTHLRRPATRKAKGRHPTYAQEDGHQPNPAFVLPPSLPLKRAELMVVCDACARREMRAVRVANKSGAVSGLYAARGAQQGGREDRGGAAVDSSSFSDQARPLSLSLLLRNAWEWRRPLRGEAIRTTWWSWLERNRKHARVSIVLRSFARRPPQHRNKSPTTRVESAKPKVTS